MTDPLVGSSPALERLREMAVMFARREHYEWIDNPDGFKGGHRADFSTCNSPNCKFVRELVPVPPAPSGAPEPEKVKRLARSFAQEWLRPDDPDKATPALVDTLQTAMLAFFSCAFRFGGVAAPAPSAPQPEMTRVGKRWTEVLCTQCGGNGVVKIHHGVSVCPRCDGRCYEPSAASGLSPSAETEKEKL